ncbi:MAG: DMT family transporter [Firmicutes bacterium]|nr:DMT family transporter [Bacillota bacterium]
MDQVNPALLGAFFGSLSLLGWGTLDFLLKLILGRVQPLQVFVGMQVAGVPLLLVALWALGKSPWPELTGLLPLTALALLYLLANLSLFQALGKGEVSIVAPITASWSMAAALLGTFVLGDRLSLLQWAAVAANMGGVILVSAGGQDAGAADSGVSETAAARAESPSRWMARLAPGAGWALVALGTFAVMNTILKPVASRVGAVEAALWMKLPAALVGALLLVRRRPAPPQDASPAQGATPPDRGALGRSAWGWFALLGLLDTIAAVAYNLGVSRAAVGVVAPVSASSPVLTLWLAAYFLKEPLERRQWWGIVLIVASLITLAGAAV